MAAVAACGASGSSTHQSPPKELALYEVAIAGTVTGDVTLTSGEQTITLNDNGMSGDRTARDGIWSARDEAARMARTLPELTHPSSTDTARSTAATLPMTCSQKCSVAMSPWCRCSR
ncbi:choice-of-anchor X domain-containing protein [Pseudoduganella sp. GCM10020061]|uniref:choice-of-anchor X domain-containing protein n=1 Tax=Pseudoduganella sp. GCM10020061 TaxID=3317345 RepID=UPI0036431AE9